MILIQVSVSLVLKRGSGVKFWHLNSKTLETVIQYYGCHDVQLGAVNETEVTPFLLPW